MIVCGFDQSPRGIGFAIGDGTGLSATGYHENPNYGDNEAALIAHIRPWVRNLMKSAGVNAAFTEQIVINKKHIDMPTLLKQCAVVCAIATECGDLGIDHYQADLARWRAWFLGTSSGSTDALKDMARFECAQRGFLTDNHHVAEAVGIFSYGLSTLDKSYRHREAFQQRRAQGRRDAERRERSAA